MANYALKERPVDIARRDRDSLHCLPLSILPIETKGLLRARMIKNVRLNSVVELFTGVGTGSGQIQLGDLPAAFGWPTREIHPDLALLRKLAPLPSYDVYSLRISLRNLGIPVHSHDALRLSPEKQKELTVYMTDFTRPLIQQIYDDKNISVNDFGDLLELFRNPDVRTARSRLEIMAGKLEISLSEVPKFLEDYGDIFLSLSYYRHCLDQIEPVVTRFMLSLDELRQNWQLRNDVNLMNSCNTIQSVINERMATITGRFENFDRSTKDMWNELTADRFRKVERLITSYHTSIGGVLCALSVKTDLWNRLFPAASRGAPTKLAAFILSEIRPGMENVVRIEDSTPMLAELNQPGRKSGGARQRH